MGISMGIREFESYCVNTFSVPGLFLIGVTTGVILNSRMVKIVGVAQQIFKKMIWNPLKSLTDSILNSNIAVRCRSFTCNQCAEKHRLHMKGLVVRETHQGPVMMPGPTDSPRPANEIQLIDNPPRYRSYEPT